MFQRNNYNVAIIGGGISGTALLFALSRYTNIVRLALFEKYGDVAEVNSHHNNNSQTLHFGDIETNYTLEKASRVKEAAEILVRYMEKYAPHTFVKGSKMVLAVGDEEVEELEIRFKEFKNLFTNLKKINKDEIGRIEPKVTEGRDLKEKLMALFTKNGYTVDYKKLSRSFMSEASKSDKLVETFLNAEIKDIRRKNGKFVIYTAQAEFEADVVAVMAGPHSLIFAKKMGYGDKLGILPVAGSFYCANDILHSKVYTMQIKKLPFAAVHGDPDVNNPKETRFGPTAKVLPLLERHNYGTIMDFIKTSVLSINGILSLFKIISDKTLFLFVLKNIGYDLPFVGKWLFLQNVRKIVPTLKYGDLRLGKGIGGIRPQVVNTATKKLEMGEAEIIGDKILFNITPSPGASVALKNAEQDTLKIISMLGLPFQFNQRQWCLDFGSTMMECRE